jgi:mRNA-degrading endonuclease RelE of RelBE toxin-antitoxin system
MMPSSFSVVPSKHYERLARLLNKRHPKFVAVQASAIEILEQDPTNRSGSHDIKKLTNVARGEGQWRLAIGRFRFRYDIYDQDVVLQYCGLRREDTY